MKNITLFLVLLSTSFHTNALDIWINEKLWTPPGDCLVHSETLITAPLIHCTHDDLTIEIILDSSYESLQWIKENIPSFRKEAQEKQTYFVRGNTEYLEIERINKESGNSFYSRLILGKYVYVHITAKNSVELADASNQVWK